MGIEGLILFIIEMYIFVLVCVLLLFLTLKKQMKMVPEIINKFPLILNHIKVDSKL